MIQALVVSLLAFAPASGPDAACMPEPATGDETLQEIYESGSSYQEFIDNATRRVELWEENTASARSIPPEILARARAIGGTWRFLAVAVDSCSDSVSTIPYLAGLIDMVDGLELRIVDSTVGRSIMESHRTADGRAATPTVLLLDEEWGEAGCFIERPPALKTWLLEGAFTGEQAYSGKMEWYDADGGVDTLEAFVTMLEAAATGAEPVCS